MKDKNGMEHDEKNGRFTSGGSTPAEEKRAEEILVSGSNSRQKAIEEKLGKEYVGFKGADAIEKLLAEKQGHIKGAFTNEKIGDIDLVWGDPHPEKGYGLSHVIQRRDKMLKEGSGRVAGVDMVRRIPQIIENGTFDYNKHRKRFEVIYEDSIVVVAPDMCGDNSIKWILTSYELK